MTANVSPSGMRTLARKVYQGAVRGALEAFVANLPDKYADRLVTFDYDVLCEKTSWKRHLHRLTPQLLFDAAFVRASDRYRGTASFGTWEPLPAFGSIGNVMCDGKYVGPNFQDITEKMQKHEGAEDVVLPRMVRTEDGREVLQYLLHKEREAEREPAPAS